MKCPAQQEILRCTRCARLTEYRERVAREKVRRFQQWEYWGKPVPSFGEQSARLLVVGLAPAAHGGNRTGRMFTGDRSGDWLYRALHRFGFASQPRSIDRHDGLKLIDCYITAAIHCAPPGNKPLPGEFVNCRPYMVDELHRLNRVQVVVPLGLIAFKAYFSARKSLGRDCPNPLPKFGHGHAFTLDDGVQVVCSYHPSQQNTQTGRLTEPMFDDVFRQARAAIRRAR
ncbi:MAG TPA: uracil-DNA glycosylase [Terriglobia bacterium]|nr:uracil-DNA glycosylase [Terriglobia bacterium]